MNGSRLPHARKGREGKGVGSGKERGQVLHASDLCSAGLGDCVRNGESA